MESQKKKAAKQSLKHRRMKMLWRRFERIRRGKMYGGTCQGSRVSSMICQANARSMRTLACQ